MKRDDIPDLHTKYVQALADASNWAGLVRYWMGHQYEPALAEAVSIVTRNSEADFAKAALSDYLTAFAASRYEGLPEASEQVLEHCDSVEKATLTLCYLYPYLALCEMAEQLPIEQQNEGYRIGLEFVERAISIAARLEDAPLEAFLTRTQARGQRHTDQLPFAKKSYQKAERIFRGLEEIRPGVYLADIALTLHNLAIAQDALQELTLARQSNQEALRIRRCLEKQRPGEYLAAIASTLSNIGQVHYALRELEEARQSSWEAVQIRRQLEQQHPGAYLAAIASPLNTLGNIQLALHELEEAEESFRETEQIYRRLEENSPGNYLADVAMTLSNLGSVQATMQKLEEAQYSLGQAEQIYRRLEEKHPGHFLARVAVSLSNLGSLQFEMHDLERARRSLSEAEQIFSKLEKHRPGAQLADLAMALSNLGLVQTELQELEEAEKSFLKALEHYRRLEAQLPGGRLTEFAIALNNLGKLQRGLRQLTEARASFREAEQIYRRLDEQQPGIYLWVLAKVLNNLGLVHSDLQEFTEAKHILQEAEEFYRDIEQQHPGAYLAEIARLLNNRGLVQRELHELDDARQSFREAEEIYRRLDQQHPGVYLAPIAMALANLGTVHWNLQELESAEEFYLEAERIYRELENRYPTAQLPERRLCAMNVGALYLEEDQPLGWPDRGSARLAFRRARDCAESQRGMFRDPEFRRLSQTQNADVYDSLSSVCFDLCQIDGDRNTLPEAIEAAEQGRSRNLLEMLAEESLLPANTPWKLVSDYRDLRKKVRHVRLRLQHEESRSSSLLSPSESRVNDYGGAKTRDLVLELAADRVVRSEERIAFVRMELDKLANSEREMLRSIQNHDPEFDPDNPIPPVKLEELRKLIPTDKATAFLHYTLTRERAFAILITPSDLSAIALPKMSLNECMPVLTEWLAVYYEKKDEWPSAIPHLLEPIAERAVRPIETELRNRKIERLIIAPHRALHVFPLHACKLADGTTTLFDLCEVNYVPSLSILHRCAQRERRHTDRLLLVENPTSNLPFTEVEGALLREIYQSPPTLTHYSYSANKADIIRDATDCHVFNYTGHATFDLMNPLQSGMVLESDTDSSKWLTLRDIFCELHLPHNRLTVINGCESGLTRGDDMADEVVGLPAGFLYAGSLAVVSSLWRVFDVSSALLIARFHEEWRKGQQVGEALRAAQRWLRDGIPSGKYLKEILISSLSGKVDGRIRQQCMKQAEHFARISPDSPPFAGEFHWAAFFASGLTYKLPDRL